MAINFNSITLEVIDLNINAKPDIFISQKGITFSKRVLEDLGYPQNVQYCVDATNKIFAIRACKGSEAKAVPFSKPKGEQNFTLVCKNKNLLTVIFSMIPNYNGKLRYKVIGEYDNENRIVYFDLTTADECAFHGKKDE